MSKSIFDLSGKVVLITGGSSYLGSAMSEILSELNSTLILASRNYHKNLELEQSLKNRYGNQVETVKLDISDYATVNQAVENILKKYKKIDVLINNSCYGAGAELLNMSEEEWIKGLDGSINGVFRLTKAVLDSMIKNKYGRIINIASMYGLVAPDVSIYEKFSIRKLWWKAGNIQSRDTSIHMEVWIMYATSPGPFQIRKLMNALINNLEKRVHWTIKTRDLKENCLLA